MIRDMTLADCVHVIGHMRERDRAGFRAALGQTTDEMLAVGRWQCSDCGWTLVVDGQPVAIGGLQFLNGWVAVMWLVVVDGLALESWRKLVRQTRTVIGNLLKPETQGSKHRVEAHVMADWLDAQKLVARLGFSYEGTRQRAGSGGEDIQVWAIVREAA